MYGAAGLKLATHSGSVPAMGGLSRLSNEPRVLDNRQAVKHLIAI